MKILLCDGCEGKGYYEKQTGYDPRDGYSYEQMPCKRCEGSGRLLQYSLGLKSDLKETIEIIPYNWSK